MDFVGRRKGGETCERIRKFIQVHKCSNIHGFVALISMLLSAPSLGCYRTKAGQEKGDATCGRMQDSLIDPTADRLFALNRRAQTL
jgi:hypothetical protein